MRSKQAEKARLQLEQFARQCQELGERAEKAERECKRLSDLLADAQQGLRWFRSEYPDSDTESDAEFDTKISTALRGDIPEALCP